MNQGNDASKRRLEQYILSVLGDEPKPLIRHSSRVKIEAALDLHTGSDSMIDILDQSRDANLAEYYLKNSLPDLKRDACESLLIHAISDRNTTFISILVKYRVRISHTAYRLVSSAMNSQDADFLAFLRSALGEYYIIIREIGSARAIDQCTKRLAPFVEEELLHSPSSEIRESLLCAGKDYLSLKTSMVLMAVNSHVLMDNLRNLHPILRNLRVKYPGPVGSVIINGWPSTLREILSREPMDVFFGFKESATKSPRRDIRKLI